MLSGLLLAALLAPAHGASVNWYVNTNDAGNAAFLAAHADVISGAYLCCNLISFNATGDYVARDFTPSIAVFTARSVETWALAGVDAAAVHSGAWARGLAAATAAAQGLLAAGLAGLIVDYEPSSDYSPAHAEAYGAFLGNLSAAIAPLRVGMDVAGWGILGPAFWPHYLQRGVSRFTSMTPTYDASNVTANRVFVKAALSALPPGSYAAGIGSVLAPGPCKWNYQWTNATLAPFVQFLTEQSVEFLDVWRCDIDSPYDTKGPDATAPFFLEALKGFLGGGARAVGAPPLALQ
jgi:hypothetical protein